MLLLGGEFAVRAKFTGKVFRVRRIILPGVVIPVGIVVGLGSGIVVVGIRTARVVVVGVVAAVLVRQRTGSLTGGATGVVVQS